MGKQKPVEATVMEPEFSEADAESVEVRRGVRCGRFRHLFARMKELPDGRVLIVQPSRGERPSQLKARLNGSLYQARTRVKSLDTIKILGLDANDCVVIGREKKPEVKSK